MEAVLNVQGMSCGGCVKSVEGALNNLDGVENVAVELETGKVNVTFNEAVVKLDDISEEIEDIGYDVVK